MGGLKDEVINNNNPNSFPPEAWRTSVPVVHMDLLTLRLLNSLQIDND